MWKRWAKKCSTSDSESRAAGEDTLTRKMWRNERTYSEETEELRFQRVCESSEVSRFLVIYARFRFTNITSKKLGRY